MAVKLHLRLLKGEQEAIGWAEIAALALVCGRIEQAQSEVSKSTTDILSLARKHLAGGGNDGDDGDTETEDEDEMENFQVKMEGRREEGVAVDVAVQEEDDVVEETVTVKTEAMECGEERNIDETREVEAGDGSETHTDVEMINAVSGAAVPEERPERRDDVRESFDEVKERVFEKDEGTILADSEGDVLPVLLELISEVTDTETVENTNCEEKEKHCDVEITQPIDVRNKTKSDREESQSEENSMAGPSGVNASDQTTSSHLNLLYTSCSDPDSEDTQNCEDKGPMANADAKTTVDETSIRENKGVYETEIKQLPVDSKVTTETNDNNNDAKKSDENKADGVDNFLEARIAKMKWWEKNVKLLERTTFCRMFQTGQANSGVVNSFITSTTDMISTALSRNSNLNSRLWIERVIAGLNHILDISTSPELLRSLATIRESSLTLEQYCAAQYSDYLQDMHYDVKSVEYLQRIDQLDMSGLAISSHFLLDQLRQDCIKYPTAQTFRTEEQWHQLTSICRSLSSWIKQLSPGFGQFSVSYLAQIIQNLGAFDAIYPNRIPVELLENLISMVQSTKSSEPKAYASTPRRQSIHVECTDDENQMAEVEHRGTADDSNNARDDENQSSVFTTEVRAENNKHSTTIAQSNKNKSSQLEVVPDAKAVREKEPETCIYEVKRVAAVTINTFRSKMKAGTCTPESALHFRNAFTRMVAVVTSNDPKYVRKLWIEQMVRACNTIVQGVQEVELASMLAPLKEYCSQLQEYSCLHFPDYLLDILNDVNTIDAFPNMNDRKLLSIRRRLLNQLRYDCIEYFKKCNADVQNVRSEEQWGQLTIVCEKLAGWVEKIPREDECLQQTVRIIADFSRRFPNRIPAMLIDRLNLNSTPTVNEMATTRTTESHTSTNIGNCANKKRYRATDSEGPDRKRPVHIDSLDEDVNRITKGYMTAASNAYDLIVAKCFSITDTKTLKTFSDMKAKATASNTALHDFLKRDGIPSENTLGAFKLATQMMTKVIRDFSSDAKEYSWMKETIRLLRELFAMRSCTTLRNVRDSLSDSISCLEICLEGNYKFEGDQVPILDTMEQRVQRYQNRHDIKSAMGPIQSIASALLVDVEQFTDNSCDPRTLVRTNENWSRFAAVGKSLSAWMNRALQSKLPNRGSLNIPNKLLAKLLKFDAKWPDRLPPGLLRNTKSLLMRKRKR